MTFLDSLIVRSSAHGLTERNWKAQPCILVNLGIQPISLVMSDEEESEESASFKRFRKLAKQVVSVPKSEIDKRAEEWRAAREADESDKSDE